MVELLGGFVVDEEDNEEKERTGEVASGEGGKKETPVVAEGCPCVTVTVTVMIEAPSGKSAMTSPEGGVGSEYHTSVEQGVGSW